MTRAPVYFAQVKAILDELIDGHTLEHLQEVHGDASFGWETSAQLRDAVVKPTGPAGETYQLIDIELVKKGEGANTNLIKALRDANGVEFNGQMPFQPPPGRHATAQEIQLIVDWLNGGMLE